MGVVLGLRVWYVEAGQKAEGGVGGEVELESAKPMLGWVIGSFVRLNKSTLYGRVSSVPGTCSFLPVPTGQRSPPDRFDSACLASHGHHPALRDTGVSLAWIMHLTRPGPSTGALLEHILLYDNGVYAGIYATRQHHA